MSESCLLPPSDVWMLLAQLVAWNTKAYFPPSETKKILLILSVYFPVKIPKQTERTSMKVNAAAIVVRLLKFAQWKYSPPPPPFSVEVQPQEQTMRSSKTPHVCAAAVAL